MSDFRMPSLGTDMEEATLIEWLVAPGDKVGKGQIIAVVETAKGAIEVEVFESGVIEELYVEPDTMVPVGAPMARIRSGKETARPPETQSGAQSETIPDTEPLPAHPPRTVPQTPVRTPAESRSRASPAARRRARELGVDLASVSGSGPDGAIVLRDIGIPVGKEPKRSPQGAGSGFDRDQMRNAIATAMTRSKREIPHYYLATTIDLHISECWLDEYNREQPPQSRILSAALFMKAAARALQRYPDLNGHYGEQGFSPSKRVNLGMAVHLRAGGVIAPAISDTETLGLPELMRRLQDLVRRARSGGLRASEIGTATATVTALGDRGVDTVYGVIHPPQVAMIGIGRVRHCPMAVADALAVRPAVNVSLAADHRVCDGHLGALFLNEIDAQLQHPEAL